MAVHAFVMATGVAACFVVLDSALRTFVLPRSEVSTFTRVVFSVSRRLFELVATPSRSYLARDRVMALYAPLTLLALPAAWLLVVLWGFAAIFWAFGAGSLASCLRLSGSSLLTLGFDRPLGAGNVAASVAEATVGLAMVALLISYLPTMYATFSRREAMVSRLAVRAGTPPSAVELLERAHLAGYLDRLDPFFEQWEAWFEEVEETHTSMGALGFFRSPNPDRSWITAAGCVLDAAALRYALVDIPFSPEPGLCIRSGYVALRTIAAVFDQPFDPDPRPDDPVAVARDEFEAVRVRLAAAGVPLRTDADLAWRDFQGWRVNYDEPLLRLCSLLMAPYAPWSSDRSLRRRPPRLRHRSDRVAVSGADPDVSSWRRHPRRPR